MRGVINCLRFLEMVEGQPAEPAFRVEADATKWIRATRGGFLEYHVAPGDMVEVDEPIATNTDLTGETQNVLRSPRKGIVLGMTTIPSVAPGDPICHLAFPRRGELKRALKVVDGLNENNLHRRIRDDLASNLLVTQYNGV